VRGIEDFLGEDLERISRFGHGSLILAAMSLNLYIMSPTSRVKSLDFSPECALGPSSAAPTDSRVGAVLDSLAGLIADQKLIYVATPINGGPSTLRIDDEAQRGASQLRYRATAARFIAGIRGASSRMVFDPTCFAEYPDWDQDTYIRVCAEVLAQFADAVVFLDDWEYSVGCLTEFTVARRRGLPTITSSGDFLTLDAAQIRVRGAIAAVLAAEPSLRSQRLLASQRLALRACLELSGVSVECDRLHRAKPIADVVRNLGPLQKTA